MEVSDKDLEADDAYLQRKKSAQRHVEKQRAKAHAQIEKEFPHDIYVDPNGARKKRIDLVNQKAINLELVTSLEYEAWRLRAMGKKVWQVAQMMETTIAQVNIWLQDALAQVRTRTAALIDLDRELELSRTEILLERYMPQALMDEVIVERIRQGEPVPEIDLTLPQKCAYICIELIKLRAKLKGLTLYETDQAMMPAAEVMGWLRTQHEFIKDSAQGAPRDVLTLETTEMIDEQPPKETTPTNGTRAPESIPDAL